MMVCLQKINDAISYMCHVSAQILGRYIPMDFDISTQIAELFISVPSTLDSDEDHEYFWSTILLSESKNNYPLFPWIERVKNFKPGFELELQHAMRLHRNQCAKRQASLIPFTDPRYPSRLRQIEKPPLCLTIVGNVPNFELPSLAVIGSRQASSFALGETLKIGQRLAYADVLVVSGGALGCDIAVHTGMLRTPQLHLNAIVVLAGGLATFYPRRHEITFQQILDRGGCIISERLWWQPSLPRDFPIRNRIVSGLSDAIVVTQAGEGSGAMITAQEALDQGREVLVLEHEHNDVRAQGSFNLIEDGAISFKNAADLFEIYCLNPLNPLTIQTSQLQSDSNALDSTHQLC
jgi:DNA protecting protein DprA